MIEAIASVGAAGALTFAGLALWLAIGRGIARASVATLRGDVARVELQRGMVIAEHAAYQRHVERQLAAKEQEIDSYDSLLGVAVNSGGDPRAIMAALVLPGQGDDDPGGRPETGMYPERNARSRLAAVTSRVLVPGPKRGLLGRLTGGGRGAVDSPNDSHTP